MNEQTFLDSATDEELQDYLDKVGIEEDLKANGLGDDLFMENVFCGLAGTLL